ncbi:MAG: hypothetical protein WCH34_01540 [Bacteroidota bacterium]
MNKLNPISYLFPHNSTKGQSIANTIFTISFNHPSISNSHYLASLPNTSNQTTYPEHLTYPSFSYIYNNSLSPKLSEVQLHAYEVQLDANEVQLHAYKVQLHAYEVQLDANEAQLHACEAQLHANEAQINVSEAQINVSEVRPALSEVQLYAFESPLTTSEMQLYANEEPPATNEVRHHENEAQLINLDVFLSLFSNSFKQNN